MMMPGRGLRGICLLLCPVLLSAHPGHDDLRSADPATWLWGLSFLVIGLVVVSKLLTARRKSAQAGKSARPQELHSQ